MADPTPLLTYEDLRDDLPDIPQEKVERVIGRAVAIAEVYCPAIRRPEFVNREAAKAIVAEAVIYHLKNEDKTTHQLQAGSYQMTNFAPAKTGTIFTATQRQQLADLMPKVVLPTAYSVQVTR